MFYNSIFSSKEHSFELYYSEDGVISYKNMHLNLDKVSDESSWWSVLHKITPFVSLYYSFFVLTLEKSISFHADLTIDDKKFGNFMENVLLWLMSIIGLSMIIYMI